MIAWRHDIRQHPELGNREFRTAKLVAEQVALPFASKETAVFRGENVGVMHACGHDSHTAMLMGVAQALASMKEDLPGEVMFIFQPAEEGAPDAETGGAAQMMAEGLFHDFKPEAVFWLHVWSALNAGQLGYRAGPAMAASDRFHIVPADAWLADWGGVDPIVAAADIIGAAQSIVSRRLDITKRAAGAQNIVEMGQITAAEGFSVYANQVPGFYFFVGSTPVGQDAATAPSNHSPKFFLDESALAVGTRATLQVSLDYSNGHPSVK